jgi:predicted GH43/DUF377 family glycosyl hydrolase
VGHISSIGFYTGTVGKEGDVMLEPRVAPPRTGTVSDGTHHRASLHLALQSLGDDHENAAHVLDVLPSTFDNTALHERLQLLADDSTTRRNTVQTIDNLHAISHNSYRVDFDGSSDLASRLLWPVAPNERHGMEDARFVRFTDDDGDVRYYGTYTAYDGQAIAQQLLETRDFVSFDVSPMAGPAAQGKGLALFPRRIDGCFVALSRSDRETNSIAFSDDIRCWPTSEPLQTPQRPWEILQLGNCGSPIETDRGWLVLTHGVGAMRTYAIGALLLDLADPRHVVARSMRPLLRPSPMIRGGYVPNVVYSCGAVAHGDVLVLPYGMNDQTIAITTLSLRELLDSLVPG